MNNDGKYNICIDICPCEECDWDEEDCILARAYQKQLPKKPLKGGNHLSDDTYNICPACSRLVGVNYAVDNRTDYCPDCGQALDWSGKDE